MQASIIATLEGPPGVDGDPRRAGRGTRRGRRVLLGRARSVACGRERRHIWDEHGDRSISGSSRCPVFVKPPAQPAAASKVADGDEVIGVVVNGKPRAYWMKALEYPPWHIVNDVVVGVPVTVTYCDRTNCTQVYTDRQSSAPLDVNLGGLYGKEMVVKIGGVLYYQESGKPFELGEGVPSLPYADHPWERTTWKEWRQRHPDTDIFIGLGGRGPRP